MNDIQGCFMFFDKIYGSWKGIQKKKYEKMMEILPNLGDKRILDIGIGSGYFEEFLKSKGIDADIIGIDTSKEMVKGNVAVADGNELPFVNNSFDMVICLDTLHLIKNNDFSRLLKRGGLVLFSIFFNKQNFEERKGMMKSVLDGFEIVKELIIEGKESEYAILAKKK